jgi:hypothetical protein
MLDSHTLGRRHELWAYRIVNLFRQDTFHFVEGPAIELKIERTADGVKLTGVPGSPQHGADARPVERPADGQVDRMLSKTFGGKTVESFDGSQVLPEAWLREFGVDAPQIVTRERRALVHTSA